MGIKHVVVGVTAGLLLAGCGWVGRTTFDDRETLGQDITEVRFSNDSGEVRISVGDTVEVRRTVRYGRDKPGRSHEVDGDVLVLRECQENDCTIDYEVTVPEGTKVSGQVASGDVELTGVASVNVEAESGNLTVTDVAGEVNASAQSGNVELSGIGGGVVADAQSGDVSVALAAPGSVSVETQSGNIDVTLPSGEYHVSASAKSGSVENSLQDVPSGLPIRASAQSGDVTVSAA